MLVSCGGRLWWYVPDCFSDAMEICIVVSSIVFVVFLLGNLPATWFGVCVVVVVEPHMFVLWMG